MIDLACLDLSLWNVAVFALVAYFMIKGITNIILEIYDFFKE